MKLPYDPYKVGNIIVASAVLHNMAMDYNETADYCEDPFKITQALTDDNNVTGMRQEPILSQLTFK